MREQLRPSNQFRNRAGEEKGGREEVQSGFPAAYPGDPALPGQERINCRCSVESVYADDDQIDDSDAEDTAAE